MKKISTSVVTKSIRLTALLFCLFSFSAIHLSAQTQAYSGTQATGNNAYAGTLGLDFDVVSTISVSQLGAFDDGGTGLTAGTQNGPNSGIRVAIFDRNTGTIMPGLDVVITGTGFPLVSNFRMRTVTPVTLAPGNYSVVAMGFNSTKQYINPAPAPITNNGGGLINFVGSGRYGTPVNSFVYPANPDGGPAARYHAGTFVFQPYVFNPNAPTINCPGDITQNTTLNQCVSDPINITVTSAGSPAPTLTYIMTGATTTPVPQPWTGAPLIFNKGVTTVSVTATNINGSSTCTFIVTINDGQGPNVRCPDAINVPCVDNVPDPSTQLADIAVNSSDNCGGAVTITWSGDDTTYGNCLNHFSILRHFKGTDLSGNVTYCTQGIVINDNVPPVLSQNPANTTISCSAALPAVPNITATDGCSGTTPTVVYTTSNTQNPSVSSCNHYNYTISRTWSAADVCGNTTNYTQTITVRDNTKPTFTCPANITVYTDAFCGYNALPAVTGNPSNLSDNCTPANLLVPTYSDVINAGACTGAKTISRTWNLSDICGNTAVAQTQTIWVVDNIPPTFTRPADITINTDANCGYNADPAVTGDVTNEHDNCSQNLNATYSDVVAPGPCTGSKVITRTWSLVDNCGNSAANQVQTITVRDNTAPTFTRPADITIYTNASCTYNADPSITGDVTNEADNCSSGLNATYSDLITNHPCEGASVIARTWSLVDNCGNTAVNQVQTITVLDNMAPTFTKPADITIYTDANCNYNASIAITGDVTNEADNCSTGLQATYTDAAPQAGACAGSYIINRTWSLVDHCGNTAANQVQKITILDNTPPTATKGTIAACYQTVAAAQAAALAATTNLADNCSTTSQITKTVSTAGTCTAIVTVTVTDNCGNSTNYTYPTSIHLSGPAEFGNPVQSSSAVQCVASATTPLVLPVIKDVCGNILNSTGPVIGGSFTSSGGCGGTVTYQYNYSDCAGWTYFWTYTYTIAHTSLPTIMSGGTPISSSVQCIASVVQPTPPVVKDVCGNTLTPAGPVVGGTYSQLNCVSGAQVPTVVYTYTYTDCANLVLTWSYTYNVVRTTAPTQYTSPSTSSAVQCAANATEPTAAQLPLVKDICGNTIAAPAAVVTGTYTSSGGCTGTKAYTYTYVDPCNSSLVFIWTYTYTISHTTNPSEFGGPVSNNATVQCPAQATQPTVAMLPVVHDVCGNLLQPVSLTPVAGGTFTSSGGCSGTIYYDFIYDDCQGLAFNWRYTYNIAHTTAPTQTTTPSTSSSIQCIAQAVTPSALPVVLDICGKTIAAPQPVIGGTFTNTGGCSGTVTYQYTYVDCAGLAFIWTYTYNIAHTTLPTQINNPPTSSSVQCISQVTYPVLPYVLDVCGNTLVPAGPIVSGTYTSSGGCGGTVIYLYNYSDCAGLPYSWTYTYTIAHTTAPTGTNLPAQPAAIQCVSAATAPVQFPVVKDVCGNTLTPSAALIGGTYTSSGGCGGTVSYQYNYTDCAGLVYIWTYTYTIAHTSIPTNTTPSVPTSSSVQCAANALSPALPTVKDVCGNTIAAPNPTVTGTYTSSGSCTGTKIYQYIYTDCAGLAYVWTYTYTISHTTNPSEFGGPVSNNATVQCPAQATQPTVAMLPVVKDVCGNVLQPVSLTPVAGGTFTSSGGCSGTIYYDFVYDDCQGLAFNWRYTYNIAHTTAPTQVTSPSTSIAVQCVAQAVTPSALPVVLDICGKTIAAPQPVIGGTFTNTGGCSGTVTYQYTYTDCAGLAFIWTYTYNIAHTTAPTQIGGPVSTSRSVQCIAQAVYPGLPLVQDVCGNTLAPCCAPPLVGGTFTSSGGCSGTVTYQYNYTDCAGLVYIWTYTYNIAHTTAPTGTNLPVQPAAIQCVSSATAPAQFPVVKDVCGNVLTPSAALIGGTYTSSGGCGGTVSYQYNYTDCAGLVYIWTYKYTIAHTTAPTNTTPSVSTSSAVQCAANALVPSLPTVKDVCGNTIQAPNPTVTGTYTSSGSCAGTKVYQYIYTDCAGLAYVWTYTYTISHTIPPAESGGPAATSSSVQCIASAVAPALPVVKDVCGNVLTPTVNSPQIIGTYTSSGGCSGTVTYIYTYLDCANLSFSWLYTYNIAHTTAPSNTTPDVPTSSAIQCGTQALTPSLPVVKDVCGKTLNPSAPLIGGTFTSSGGCGGTVTYQYNYIDCAGLTLIWTYTYNIAHTTTPFPTNTVPTSSSVQCIAQVVLPGLPFVQDVCGNLLAPCTNPLIGGTYTSCGGTVNYTYTWTDCAGLYYIWTYTYTIAHTTPPTATNIPAQPAAVQCVSSATAPTQFPVVMDVCGNTLTPAGPVIDGTYSTSAVVITAPGSINIPDVSSASPYPAPLIASGLPITGVSVQSVTLNGFSHTWTGDLDVVLQSPTGQNVILMGLSQHDWLVPVSNANVTFSDAASQSYPSSGTLASGTYKPTNIDASPFSFNVPGPQNVVTPIYPSSPTLSTFTGNMNGTWNLYVEDRVGGDIGQIAGGYTITFVPSCSGTKTYTYTYTDCANLAYVWSYSYTIAHTTPPAQVGGPVSTSSNVQCVSDATPPVGATLPNMANGALTRGGTLASLPNQNSNDWRNGATDSRTLAKAKAFAESQTLAKSLAGGSANTSIMPANGSTVPSTPNSNGPTLPVVVDVCGNTLTPGAPVIGGTYNSSGGCTGTVIYQYTYTDCAGLAYVWTYTYTISHTTNPSEFGGPVSNNATVQCPAQATQPTVAMLPVVHDVCGNILQPVSLTPVAGGTFTSSGGCSGTIYYDFIYDDCQGLAFNWRYTYNIAHTTAPTQVTTPLTSASIQCVAQAVTPSDLPVVMDICGKTIAAPQPVIGGTYTNTGGCSGTVTYQYTYVDCAGLAFIWTYTYNIAHTTLPTQINNPPTSSSVQCISQVTYPVLPYVLDVCGNTLVPAGPIVSGTYTSSGGCGGTVIYMYNYSDCAGLPYSWTYTYTIAHTTAPAPLQPLPSNSSTVQCGASAVTPTSIPQVYDVCGNTITPTEPVVGGTYGNSGNLKVLVAGAPGEASWNTDVQSKLIATGQFSTVDVFNILTGTPTVAQLQNYNAVLVFTDASAQDPTLLGNNLAAYIDGGGAVVDAVFDNASYPIQGAYNTATYRVLNPLSQTQGTTRTLGTVLLPSHPIMQGVTSFNGGTNSYRSTSNSLTAGSYSIALYDDNEQFIMAKENVGLANVRRVSLNFYPPSQDSRSDFWVPSTDGARIMANSLTWAANGNSNGNPCQGTKTYTYTYTDCANLAYVWTYTYTIAHTTPPINTTPSVSTASAVQCIANAVTPALPTVVDICGVTISAPAPVIGGTYTSSGGCTGTVTYRYAYTDCSGLAYVWTYTYTISHTTNPSEFGGPVSNNATVQCPAQATQPTVAMLPVVHDVCGNVLQPVSLTPVAGGTFTSSGGCSGTIYYDFIYDDCQGLAFNWRYTYNIAHTTAPTQVTSPSTSIAVQCVAQAVTPATLPVVLDICGKTIVAPQPVIGGTYTNTGGCSGTVTYQYTYTDCAGLAFIWTYSYSIAHTTAPTEFGGPVSASSAVQCATAASAPIASALPVVKDVCGNVLSPIGAPVVGGTYTTANNTCSGTVTYQYTYTDCANLAYVWTYTYTIAHVTPPQPLLPLPSNASTVQCGASAVTPASIPHVYDVCGNSITPTLLVSGSFTGKILIAYSDNCSSPTTLRNQLLALPGVTQVDLFNAFSGTPTLAQMQSYGMVVAFSNNTYNNPVSMGNNLADYQDGGGIVVGLNFDYYGPPFGLDGRWVTGGYTPYNPGPTVFSNGSLGVFTPGHPLMQGVTALNAYFRHNLTLTPGATQVAAYNDGQSLIAYKGRAVGINAYVGECPNQWSGDFAKVIVNAGNWLGGGTCQGTKTYQYTYTDCANLAYVWTYTYTIAHTTPPTNTTPSVPTASAVQCIANAMAPALPTVVDICGVTIAAPTPVIGGTYTSSGGCTGTVTYRYAYTDCAGLAYVWTYTYSIAHTQNPAPVTFPATTSTIQCLAGAVSPPLTGLPVVMDACGITAVLQNINPQVGGTYSSTNCGNGATITYTYVWDDCQQLYYSWTYTYVINRTQAPVQIGGPVATASSVQCVSAATVPSTLPLVMDVCGNTVSPAGPVIDGTYTTSAVAITAPGSINIPDLSSASPYPAPLIASGLPITGVSVQSITLNGFSHTWTGDLDVVLQSPTGQNVILMGLSQQDWLVPVSNANVTFSDAASQSYPSSGTLASGTYKPTNIDASPFSFNVPGPQNVVTPVYPSSPTLSTFTGNMNGTWNLFVEDRVGGDIGQIAGGYTITFNAPPCSGTRTYTYTYADPCQNNLAYVWTYTYTIAHTTAPMQVGGPVSTSSTVQCASAATPPSGATLLNPATGKMNIGETNPMASLANPFAINWNNGQSDPRMLIKAQAFAASQALAKSLAGGSANTSGMATNGSPVPSTPSNGGPTLPVVVDVCGNTIIPSGPVIGGTYTNNCAGTITYQYTYADCAGLVYIWTYTYNIAHTTPPHQVGGAVSTTSTIQCVSGIGNCSPCTILPVVQDICGNVLTPGTPVISGTYSTNNCGNGATVIYTYTYTDCANLAYIWTYTYVINRTTPPHQVGQVPVASSVQCVTSATAPTTLPVVVDVCGLTLLPNESDPVIGGTYTNNCAGTRTYQYTYWDPCQNNLAYIWTYTYTIQHTTPPQQIGSVSDHSNIECITSATPPAVLPLVKDVCGNILDYDHSGPQVNDNFNGCSGTRTYTYVYDDCQGLPYVWTYHYFIAHVTPPSEFGGPVSTSSNVQCASQATYPQTRPVVHDVCGNTLNPGEIVTIGGTYTANCSGTITYTFHYKDCAQLTFDWTYTYNIAHTTPPTNTTPTVSTSSAVQCVTAATAPSVLPVVMDICNNLLQPTAGSPVIGGTYTTVQGTCSGTRTYQYTYTDCANLSYIWTYTYTIGHTTPPNECSVPNAPTSSTVQCAAAATPPAVIPMVRDVCGNTVLNYSGPVQGGTYTGCGGTITYTYTWTDCAGLSFNWTYTYTIAHTTAPVIPVASLATAVQCVSAATVPANVPVVVDVCGNAITPTLVVVDSPIPLTCNGTRSYNYTYTDCAGLTAMWSYVYQINHTTAPVVPANSGSIVQCYSAALVAPVIPTVFDVCGTTITPSLISTSQTGTTCNGTLTYTYRYADCAGQGANWVYVYTYNDNTPPTFTSPGNVTVYFSSGNTYNASPTITGFPTNVADNCTATGLLSQQRSDLITQCGNNMIIDRTWKVTDACNNSTIAHQIITVTDNNTLNVIFTKTQAQFGTSNTINGSVGVTDPAGTATFAAGDVMPAPYSATANTVNVNGAVLNQVNNVPAIWGITPQPLFLPWSGPDPGPSGLNLSNIIISSNGTVSGNKNNVTINPNKIVTLTGNNFGTITVGSGAQLTFTSATVQVTKLILQPGLYDLFNNQVTNLKVTNLTSVLVRDGVTIGQNTKVNLTGPRLTFYMGDGTQTPNFTVQGGHTQITANVMNDPTVPVGYLTVNGSASTASDSAVVMTGWYLVNNLTETGTNVTWNRYTCAQYPSPAIIAPPVYVKTIAPAEVNEELSVKAYPNPSTSDFNIMVLSTSNEPVTMRILDMNGVVRGVSSPQLSKTNTFRVGGELNGGTYIAEIIQGRKRATVKLVKLN